MFKIALKKIYITQGDTARFSIRLTECGTVYELSAADSVYFIVTDDKKIVDIDELASDPNVLFYKEGIDVVIDPADTKELQAKRYWYHVRVVLGISGDINTIVDPQEFYVTV